LEPNRIILPIEKVIDYVMTVLRIIVSKFIFSLIKAKCKLAIKPMKCFALSCLFLTHDQKKEFQYLKAYFA
jgi:hypothetical protein